MGNGMGLLDKKNPSATWKSVSAVRFRIGDYRRRRFPGIQTRIHKSVENDAATLAAALRCRCGHSGSGKGRIVNSFREGRTWVL